MPTVLMIGGGQLSRMTHQAGIGLGINFRVLANELTESAGQVVRDVHLGSHEDLTAILRAAENVDVITFDHEHVPLEYLAALEDAGYSVHPKPQALAFAQDKLQMRLRIGKFTGAQPAFAQVSSTSEVVDFAEKVGWPVVLKVARGGYDGRGVWVCEHEQAVRDALSTPTGSDWVVEARVNFSRELTAQVVRSSTGEMVFYPVVETQQDRGMCAAVIAPAPNLDSARVAEIQALAAQIAEELDVTGILAVELFDTGDAVLVNELAMRPHNSGHWSMNGAVTSQFENHLRAVMGWPLGDTSMITAAVVMVNLIGTDAEIDEFGINSALIDPQINLHLYGKAARPRRKIGHINLLGSDPDELLEQGRLAAAQIVGTEK